MDESGGRPAESMAGVSIDSEHAGPQSAVEVTLAEEIPTAVPEFPIAQGGGIDLGLAEIFEEFRLEAESDHASSKEDFETHYNMAIAYGMIVAEAFANSNRWG